MQSLNWYFQRLRGMSSSEVVWRARSEVRDQFDRLRFALGLYPALTLAPGQSEFGNIGATFRLHDWDTNVYRSPQLGIDEVEWQAHLLRRARKLLKNQISFFSLNDLQLDNPVDWSRDYESN